MNSKDKSFPRIRGVQPEVQEAARIMRHDPTQSEEILWNALRDRQLGGLKFRRQHPVGNVILDFYCRSAKLAIELDGGVHDNQVEHDQARTEHLESYGLRVIRFRNEEVVYDLPSVLKRILDTVRE